MKIQKRNGKIVDYDGSKIIGAVNKAIAEVGSTDNNISTIVEEIVKLHCKDMITVEEIQDLVVKTLLGLGVHDIANHYISYRAIRSHERKITLENLYNRMTDIVEFGDDENSNKNYKLPSVKRDTIAGEYFRSKLFDLLPKHIAYAHKTKAIHWHDSDVDVKLTNCSLINIEDMLKNGTRITNADIETPKSVGTAMNIAMQIMASVSASQYGGVSLPNFNEVFAEYAKKNFAKNFVKAYNANQGLLEGTDSYIGKDTFEQLTRLKIESSNESLEKAFPTAYAIAKQWTKKEIYDACQLFEYQTNSILGSASQTPQIY